MAHKLDKPITVNNQILEMRKHSKKGKLVYTHEDGTILYSIEELKDYIAELAKEHEHKDE